MKILTRYVLRQFMGLFLLFFISFVAIFVIVDLFDNLDDLLQYEVSARELFLFYLNFVPPVIVQTIPVAILLASITLFRKISVDNEYVAMVGGGFSLRSMLTPLVYAVGGLCLAAYAVNDFIVPRAHLNQQRIKAEKFYRAENPSRLELKNLSVMSGDKRLLFIRFYHVSKKTMENIMIIESGKDNLLLKKIMAEKGVWQDDHWVFENVRVFDFEGGYVSEKMREYRELSFKLEVTPVDLILAKNTPEFMSTWHLRSLLKRIPDENSSQRLSVLVEFHRRFAFSFVGLATLFVAVPFGLMQKRGPQFMSVGIGVIIGLCYYLVLSIFLSLGKGGIISPALAAWAANLIFAAIALVLIPITPR